MSRAERKALLQRIEQLRGTRVVAYVTGDRQPTPAQIGDDALRPMYEHLRAIGHVPELDLLIYSRGGAIDVPWRVVTALRRTAEKWNVLIPFRAHSAATLIALGADKIVLGRHGELGPIDPRMSIQRVVPQPGGPPALLQDEVSVEDVFAYLRFVRDRAGLSDQAALSMGLAKLADRLDPVSLGSAHRTHSHIRDVARRMLLSRSEPPNEQVTGTIIETLAERVYAHGHAIGMTEAASIGLPVEAAGNDLDDAMWSLLQQIEQDLKLLEPVDPVVALSTNDPYREDGVIALVESTWAVHEFAGQLEIRGRRAVPPSLSVTLNLSLNLPPGVAPQQLPQAVQQVLQQMVQQAQQTLLQQAQQAVQQALQQQAPLTGWEAGFRGGLWRRSD